MRLEGNVTDAPNLTFAPVNIPKHYQDTWSFRLGGQVEPLDWLQLRAGGYFETGAVPEAYTNLDFASFDRMGVGGGTSFLFSGFTLSLAYSHVFQADRTVTSDETEVYKQYPTQPDTPPNLPQFKVGAGKFETSYDVFSAAVSYGF
jgi:long-subunit fatty acid transport protein